MKVSIIVATFNDKEHLQMTLDSILEQTYSEIECVVVDGGSTDGTKGMLVDYEERYREKNKELQWKSEPDMGIYDAINKGILRSSGELIGVLYDLFASSDIIGRMVKVVEQEQTDGIHGDLEYRRGDQVIRYWKTRQGKIENGWIAGHPTLYLKREIYERYGLYRTDYKCAGDYEFQVRAFYHTGIKLSYIPEVLVYMFYGGTSNNNFRAYMVSLREGNRALRENKVRAYWFVTLKRTFNVLLQFRG